MSGNDVRSLSDQIQNLFNPLSDSEFRLQWRWKRYWHACHDPDTQTVYFFVSLSGGPPRHALAYRYGSQSWDILEYPIPIMSSCLGRVNGRRQVFGGAFGRQVLAINAGQRDGGRLTGTLRGTVTSSTLLSLSDSAASFSSSLVGVPVRIVEGKGRGQQRIITAVTSVKLTVDQLWTTQPDSTSVYQVGGVHWRWRSGRYRWVRDDFEGHRAIEADFDPRTAASTLLGMVYKDRDTTSLVNGQTILAARNNGVKLVRGERVMYLDATKENGFVRQELDQPGDSRADGERMVKVELDGTTNGEPHRIFEIGIEGATQ
jgi:hypothetical protein